MNSYTSNKYIFSPRRRGTRGGLFIVIPNQARSGNMALNYLRPLAALLHRVCPG
jgi:hypothetical protein